MEILSNYIIEIIFGLISAGALAFCKHLHSQNKELKKLQEADKTKEQRQMILNEIEPIIQELTIIHNEIDTNKINTQAELAQMKLDAYD